MPKFLNDSGLLYFWNKIKAAFAPIAKGVTNGDSHNHSGGDGAQLDHTNLANKGANSHAEIDTALTRLSNTSGTNTGDQVIPDRTYDLKAQSKSSFTYSLAAGESADFVISCASVVSDIKMYVNGVTTLASYRSTFWKSDPTNAYRGTNGIGFCSDAAYPCAIHGTISVIGGMVLITGISQRGESTEDNMYFSILKPSTASVTSISFSTACTVTIIKKN